MEKVRLLTFDIEDWFHLIDAGIYSDSSRWLEFEQRVENGVELILSLLKKRNISATFFILGWVAEVYPAVVKKIRSAGHEIGCHSFEHLNVSKQSPMQFEVDLQRALTAIERACGFRPVLYRAPGFSVTQDTVWVYEILLRNGISMDASIFLGRHAHGGFQHLDLAGPFTLAVGAENLRCFPMPTTNFLRRGQFCVTGGGYFRLCPEWMVKAYIARSRYIMTYFHPRDFDAHHPKLELSFFRKLRANVGREGASNKLASVLDSFEFTSISQANGLIDWSKAPAVDLSYLSGAN